MPTENWFSLLICFVSFVTVWTHVKVTIEFVSVKFGQTQTHGLFFSDKINDIHNYKWCRWIITKGNRFQPFRNFMREKICKWFSFFLCWFRCSFNNKFFVQCNFANSFVTGGTGFLGTVLIEALLSSTPKIGKIYLLIRDKYGSDTRERIKRLLSKQVSCYLREFDVTST